MADGTEAPVRTCFLGLPHNGSMVPGGIPTLGMASSGALDVRICAEGSSLLCFNFNRLWANALNTSPRPDLFAMLHSDIEASAGWLDTLARTLHEEQADLVSAVVPIKDFQGVTSTAVIDPVRGMRRRLTTREVAALPEVFDAKIAAEALGVADPSKAVLCVNTGMFVCRFGSWAEKFRFHTGDEIRYDGETGKFAAHVFPEDWLMSAELAALGLKVVATRRVPVTHYGLAAFGFGGEMKPWGSLEADEWRPA